jgi:hypothetical protein
MRRHLWVEEKREALKGRQDDERRAAEVAKQNHAGAVAKERLDNLLGMATDYRQARAIRLFVSAMRRRSRDAEFSFVHSLENIGKFSQKWQTLARIVPL